MSVFVKICGIRDVASARAAADAGADALGFVFAESPRRIAPADAAALSHGLPRGVRRVAVMRHPSNEEWRQVLDVFRPDVLQTDSDDFDALDIPDTVARWPVIRENAPEMVPDTEMVPGTVAEPGTISVSGTFLYEGADSGTGETVDWSRAARVARCGRMILAGGLDPDNVGAAIREVRPWGVDVSSGVESERGIKDVERIRQFIGAVRAAETEL